MPSSTGAGVNPITSVLELRITEGYVVAEGQGEFQGTERFGILRRIGAGGMGVVYEAYDRERESLVALKTLRQASPDTIFLFKQEFR